MLDLDKSPLTLCWLQQQQQQKKIRGCYGTMSAALEIKVWQTQLTLHQQKMFRWIVRFSFQLI